MMYPDHNVDHGDRSRQGTILRSHSHGKILETHFDDPAPAHHTRSSSYSVLGSHHQERSDHYADTRNTDSRHNLNNSFPGDSSSNTVPYISSSVTLPASNTDLGFYHNITGRIRQPSVRQYKREVEQEQRHPHSRAADLHKSPRTQELEEFAAKFEGYQKQRTRRLAQTQPTPMLDQLARETNNQFWLSAQPDQLTSLESSLLRLVQRNDSITGGRAHMFTDETLVSGRESVATVLSTSSSDCTIKFNERHCSSETLKYYDPGDNDNGAVLTAPDNAVRGHRTGSICDEHYLGHNNNWSPQQQYTGLAQLHSDHGHSGVKRTLFRSHSESHGTRDDGGHVYDTSHYNADHQETTCVMTPDARQRQDPVPPDNMVSRISIINSVPVCANNSTSFNLSSLLSTSYC